VAFALLPVSVRAGGALAGFPFIVIAAMAAWRQRQLPSAARIEQVRLAIGAMAWPAFSALLEQAFARDGYRVARAAGSGKTAGVDFVLERQGRRMLVSARRWKSAQTGIETLRALQAAREAAEEDLVNDALVIGLGDLTDTARAFAAEHRIAVWQAAEVAQALRGVTLGA
jgi:restriction system protein